jgi:hypothetical protein
VSSKIDISQGMHHSTDRRNIAMETQEIKQLLKETIREVLREERLSLCMILIPYASEKENQEIQAKFGSPTQYSKDEFVDMTDWVKHEA